MDHHFSALKTAGDITAGAVAFVTLVKWLPPMAAALTIVWTLIRIWESKTVQGWVSKWK